MGITTALSPQIDMATDPRWMRFNGTFGEDAKLSTDIARAYIDGFQTSYDVKGWRDTSVNAMVKHWPGGGSGEAGRDARYGFGILAFLNALMGGVLLMSYLKLAPFMVAVVALAFITVAYAFIKLVDKKHYRRLRQVAKVGVLLSVLPILVINIIKMNWGRERFRHMTAPFSTFTPWYLPQSLTTNNEFMSLPSGHSANSSVIYWITLIPLFLPSLKKYEKSISIFSVIWIIMVMLSRVIVGAHFASDVVMGMTLSISIFWLLKWNFVKE